MKHADYIKYQFDYNRKQVFWLTKINEQQYESFQIDTGKAFAERYLQGKIDTDALMKTKLFWQWWCYMWNNADEKFIIAELYRIFSAKPELCYGYYRELHQYVFAEGTNDFEILMADFRNLRDQFEIEIKQQKIVA